MRQPVESLNLLAMMADAEARATANLIEMVAAASLMKLAPPEGEAIARLTISQDDLDLVLQGFRYDTAYDEHGAMNIFLTRIVPKSDDAEPESTPK